MGPELYTNNYLTTLNGAITSGATSLTVNDAPPSDLTVANGVWRILIDSEIMVVTGVSGSTLTVIRGQEGTTAASHLSGTSVVHLMTRDSMKRVANAQFWPGTRYAGKCNTVNVKGGTIAASATGTLLNLGSGAGWIKGIFLGLDCSDWQARERSVFKVTVNGDVSPSLSCTVCNLHCADYAPNNPFFTRYIGYNNNTTTPSDNSITGSTVNGSGTNIGYSNLYNIPFQNGVKVELTNGSSTTTLNYWLSLQYYTPTVPMDFGRRVRLKNNEQRTNVTAYAEQDLLNISGRGALWQVYMLTDSNNPTGTNNGFHHLEGRIKMYIDGEGTASYQSSGTEDYFMMSNYFQSGFKLCDTYGCTKYFVNGSAGAFRIHEEDPIEFETGIRVTWTAGIASVATVGYNPYLSSNVLYYLDQ